MNSGHAIRFRSLIGNFNATRSTNSLKSRTPQKYLSDDAPADRNRMFVAWPDALLRPPEHGACHPANDRAEHKIEPHAALRSGPFFHPSAQVQETPLDQPSERRHNRAGHAKPPQRHLPQHELPFAADAASNELPGFARRPSSGQTIDHSAGAAYYQDRWHCMSRRTVSAPSRSEWRSERSDARTAGVSVSCQRVP